MPLGHTLWPAPIIAIGSSPGGAQRRWPGAAHPSTGSRTVASRNHILKPPRMFRPAGGPKLLTGPSQRMAEGVVYLQGPTNKDRGARIRAHPGELEGASNEAPDDMAHRCRAVCRHGAPGVARPSEGPRPKRPDRVQPRRPG